MKNDTESIVKEFLELWQKQCAYISRDGDSASQALDAFRQMQESYVNSMGAGLGNTGNAQSTATSDLSRNTGDEFSKLAKSHAELEKRVARLESLIGKGVAGSSRKTTAKRPPRTGKGTAKTNN